MIRSIALTVGWGGDRATRLRSVVLAVATAVVTGVALIAVSAGLLTERVNERAAARTFQPVSEGQPADLSSDAQYDSVNGEAIFVYFWRIETPGVTIPGLPADAETGEWFVSPELHRRIQTEPVLDGRFGDTPEIIGDDGVGAADELVAHRLVGPDVELRFHHSSEPGNEWIGLNAGIDGPTIILGAVGLVLVIGTGFLRAALGPVSVGLEKRLQTLHILGAPRATLARISFMTTAVVALPGAALAGIGWYLIAPTLTQVPLVNEPTLQGDLAIPIWLALGLVVAVTTLTGALGLGHLGHRVGSRPTSRIPDRAPLWRAIPLAGAIGLISYATALSGTAAVRLLLIGLLTAALSVTFALPVILDRLGSVIAQGGSALTTLVGRRLAWNAATSARPLIALAALAVLVPVAASYIAVSGAGDPPPPHSTVSAFHLGGAWDTPTLENLERDANGVIVDVYSNSPAGNEAPTSTWVADCDKLSGQVTLQRCDQDAIIVAPDAAPAFAGLTASSTTPPPGDELQFRLFVTGDQQNAERVIRAFVVNSERTDISVTTVADHAPKEPKAVAWIMASIKIAATGAFLALLLSVSTSASQSAKTRLRLIALGARLDTIRRLAATESFVVVAVVGLGGTAVGTIGAVAYALVDGSVDPNYAPSSVIAAATIAAAGLAGLTSATQINPTNAHQALNNPD